MLNFPSLPTGRHRHRILAYRNRDAKRRAKVTRHRAHRIKKCRIFAGLTSGSHPVGRQMDV